MTSKLSQRPLVSHLGFILQQKASTVFPTLFKKTTKHSSHYNLERLKYGVSFYVFTGAIFRDSQLALLVCFFFRFFL